MIYIVMIINVILTIWLYKKYIHIPKIQNNQVQEMENLDSALIGYIENEDGNSIDWILAEILELDRKGYIKIEYQRKDIDKYEYIIKKIENKDLTKLKKYELSVYRLLFGDQNIVITLNELEEKILKSVEVEKDVDLKSLYIRNEIEEELINLNIIDATAKRNIKNIRNINMLITLIIVIFIKDINITHEIIILLQSIIVLYIISKAKTFTAKGKKLYIQIKEYKKTLEDNKILKEKKIIHNVILEKDFINSIALHIMTKAKKEFINDEIIEKKVKNTFDKMRIVIYFIIYIIYMFSLFNVK